MSSWYTPPAILPSLQIRRKVFISFSQVDRPEVDEFVGRWTVREPVFIARAVGLSYGADLINSADSEYVMNRIRADYLGDSTVTIVLLGRCTHSRRYVDWELKSSLRKGTNTPNGVLGILLPSAGGAAHLPPRFEANWNPPGSECYARYRPYPCSSNDLRAWIEDAFSARTGRAEHIQNSADLMKYNARCRACGITHPA